MKPTLCLNCAWLLTGTNNFTCYAYAPGDIPEDIATGQVSHLEERGDEVRKGVFYKPLLPDEPEESGT